LRALEDRVTAKPNTIMVIDDEPDIRLYLQTALEDEGYSVNFPQDIENLTQSIEAVKPDLICLDIMMPKKSGISLYIELKRADHLKDIPIIVITSMSPIEDFKEDGFRELIQDDRLPMPDEFLEKPIQIPNLLEMITHLLAD